MKIQENSNILEMAHGAIMEQVDIEVTKVMQNILDPNTNATKARSITVTVEFKADDDRSRVFVSASAKSKLLPNNPIRTSLYVGADKNGEIIATELVPNIPGQSDMFGEEQENPKIMRIAI